MANWQKFNLKLEGAFIGFAQKSDFKSELLAIFLKLVYFLRLNLLLKKYIIFSYYTKNLVFRRIKAGKISSKIT